MDVAFADKTLYEETSGKMKTGRRQTRRARPDYEYALRIRDQEANHTLEATAINVSKIKKIYPYAIGVESFYKFKDPKRALSVWCSMLTDEQKYEREQELIDQDPDPFGEDGDYVPESRPW